MVPVVNLFPHVQVVVSAGIELKRHTAYVMKHEVGAEHVDYVGEGPRCFLRDPRDDVEEDFEYNDEDNVDSPCT